MRCVYCLENKILSDRQILHRGQNLYLCAPLGQMVEGFLVIAPYQCIGALSKMPFDYIPELENLIALVAEFYAKAYRTSHTTCYEQGRAGGGASRDEIDGFPMHAHLCCLPQEVDLDAILAQDYHKLNVTGFQQLSEHAPNEPYIYVKNMNGKSLYVATDSEGRMDLERKRLKPEIASLLGIPERGYWRTYPGYQELDQLIKKWRNIWPKPKTQALKSLR